MAKTEREKWLDGRECWILTTKVPLRNNLGEIHGTFGISELKATHLLDDVQHVCDHVLMIDAGRLVVSGPTDALLERTGVAP